MINLTIYTDGSHFKGKTDFIGLGGVCTFDGEDYQYSTNIPQEIFKTHFKCKEEVSNPTAELASVAGVLEAFINLKVPVSIEIVADYNGVKHWCEGTWKANKPQIILLLDFIRNYTYEINKNGGCVTYRHVGGHQKGCSDDAIGNNKSDVMAKSLTAINTFPKLVTKLMQNSI